METKKPENISNTQMPYELQEVAGRFATRGVLDKPGLPKAQPIKMHPVVPDSDDDDDVPLTMTGGL